MFNLILFDKNEYKIIEIFNKFYVITNYTHVKRKHSRVH